MQIKPFSCFSTLIGDVLLNEYLASKANFQDNCLFATIHVKVLILYLNPWLIAQL